MNVLGLDTATPATVVGVLRSDGGGAEVFEARHDPGRGERPGHATRLLGLVDASLRDAGLEVEDLDRIAVGTGPGSFTGLRIGIATARGMAQGLGAQLAGVSTLEALAAGADAPLVVAVVDARRGEVFAAAWRDGAEVMAPAALAPETLAGKLAGLGPAPLAVGDGALRFRRTLEPAGAAIPPDGDPLHRVSARQVCRLGAEAQPEGLETVLPEYVRPPDAKPRSEQPKS